MSLSGRVRPDTPDPTLALDTTRPAPAAPQGEPVVTVFLTNGVRTSAGPGPGVKVLPAIEAGRLVSAKLAVYGDRSPEAADPEPLARTFGGPIPPARPAHSN